MFKSFEMQLIFRLFSFSLILSVLFGCSATHTLTQDDRLIQSAGEGKYSQVSETLEKLKEKGRFKEKDIVLYYLNQGMLLHFKGDYIKSNEYLTLAERKIEDLFTKSISKTGASFLLNDNVLDYAGEDFEDIYLNVFKALNYIHLGQKDHAFVEVNRVQNKLRRLKDKYLEYEKQVNANAKEQKKGSPPEAEAGTIRFHNCALARYVSMLMYLIDNETDNADIDRRKIKEAWNTQPLIYNHEIPSFIENPDLEKSNLHILAFSGITPAKKSSTYYITTLKDALNVTSTTPQPFSAFVPWLGMEPNYHFKFSIPYMERYHSEVSRIRIEIDGQPRRELELLESMENVAMETFNIKSPLIYFKTLARTVVKGLTAAEAKKEIDKSMEDNPDYIGAFLAKAAIDVAMDLTESADLRTSMFFPAKAMVATFVVPPGIHDIRVSYLDSSGNEVYSELYEQMDIRNNKMSFIETYYLK